MGIVGAFVVPALVSTGSNNFLALFVYISLVSGSAIWVAESVRKNWLWWQSFLGHFFWLTVTTLNATSNDFVPVLLFCVVSIYLYSMAGVLGWKLQDTQSSGFSGKLLFMPRKEQVGVLLSVVSMGFYLVSAPDDSNMVWVNVVLAGVLGFAAFRHSAFDTWPFVMLVFACGSYLLMPDVMNYEDNVFLFQSGYLFIQLPYLTGTNACVFLRFKLCHVGVRSRSWVVSIVGN